MTSAMEPAVILVVLAAADAVLQFRRTAADGVDQLLEALPQAVEEGGDAVAEGADDREVHGKSLSDSE
jgi:hypothetical protein